MLFWFVFGNNYKFFFYQQTETLKKDAGKIKHLKDKISTLEKTLEETRKKLEKVMAENKQFKEKRRREEMMELFLNVNIDFISHWHCHCIFST